MPIDIVAACDDLMAKSDKRYPRHANRASDIGDDCERKLVYERTHWEFKKPYDLGLLYVFAVGNRLEGPVIRQMQDAGVKLIRQQEPFQHKANGELLLTGHIDAIVEDEGKQIILEIKTMSEHIWETTQTAQDFRRHHWSRKYAPQLNAYCFGLEIPSGLWILVNKQNGRLKQIPWELDYGMAEETLKRCERINAHVKANTLPDYPPNTPEAADYCEGCPFFGGVCKPPINRESLELIVDAELIKLIDTMFLHEPSAKVYEDAKELLKETKLKGIKKAAIGPYMYDGSKRVWKSRWTKPEGQTEDVRKAEAAKEGKE